MPAVGILALQGDFEAHARALRAAGLPSREVRTAMELMETDGLVLPGGESTTIWTLMEGTGLESAIRDYSAAGRPVLATCAGAILLSRRITNPEGRGLALLDITSVRNAYGRQLDSSVAWLRDVDLALFGTTPLEAVFIRAPRFADPGPAVEVLARLRGDPVLVRSGGILAATFHPELTADIRVHRLFVETVLRGTGARSLSQGGRV